MKIKVLKNAPTEYVLYCPKCYKKLDLSNLFDDYCHTCGANITGKRTLTEEQYNKIKKMVIKLKRKGD